MINMASKLHIIWDLDGTLIDSEEEVLDSLIKSVREAGLSEDKQIAPFRVGPTIDKILEAAYPCDVLNPQIKANIISNFRKNYDNCGFNRTLSFDGIEEILSNNAFIHHIVTNKPDCATNRIIEKLHWQQYFKSIITPYSFIKCKTDERKSKTQLFALCIAEYPNERFIGVGDMATDTLAALNNNIESIGVLWGTGTREELISSGCTFLANSVKDLSIRLNSLCNS